MILDAFYMLQLIYFFPLGRFYFPTGLFKFFKAFELLNFQNINFGIWDFNDAATEGLLTVHGDVVNYNFQKMGFSTSSFIFTSIDVILVVIYFLFFSIFIRMLAQVFRKSVWIRYLENVVIGGIFIFILNSTSCILCMTAFLNINEWNVVNETETFGSISSYMYLFFVGFAVVMITIFIILYWWGMKKAKIMEVYEDKPIQVRNLGKKFLFSYNKDRNFFHYLYPLIFLLRRIGVAAVFAFMHDDGFMQLLCLSLMSGGMLAYHTSYQPFKSSIRNIMLTVFEGAYLLICLTIFPYVYPNLKNDLFLGQADVVVGLFLFIFFIALSIPTGILLFKL